jgi:7-cyano-7-deazaguanine reductase
MDLQATLLGRQVDHEPSYSPSLLMPLPRQRLAPLAPAGADRWTGYELSWLDENGKPDIAMLQCDVPANSPAIVESKSFKLYLNSFARRRASLATVQADIERDLAAAAGAPVAVRILRRTDWMLLVPVGESEHCIDDIELADPALDALQPAALSADGADIVEEALSSHLFRSNCPVTGQPDWASVSLHYRGPRIDRAGLLRYWLSFRSQREFHEQCVERMYSDIAQRCAPQWFAVQARFTRRGGLDIHPLRASAGPLPWLARSVRQ